MDTTCIRTRTIAATAAILAATTLGATTPAAAADEVIASDTTVAAAPAALPKVPTATAARPRTITVTNHRGQSVTLFAKGERIRRILAPGARPATFTGLTAGRTYTVAVGGRPIGTVVALSVPAAASGLQVRTTAAPDSVRLTWRHTPTVATGGRALTYDITATSPGLPSVRTSVVGVRSATLTGLDPRALYRFTVVPRNSAGRGPGTSASMTRTLAQVSGAAVPTGPEQQTTPATARPVVEQQPAPTPPPAPAPGPGPAPAPGPAPKPSTKTIWVCPDGYTETPTGVCQKTMAYTYHEEVETSPYTYHSEQQVDTITVPATHNGTIWTWSCPSGYSDGGGQWGVGVCKGAVLVKVKDAPPQGWYDTGSAYGHDIDVQDPMPTGYLDDGTQWVTTTAKVAKVVPA